MIGININKPLLLHHAVFLILKDLSCMILTANLWVVELSPLCGILSGRPHLLGLE